MKRVVVGLLAHVDAGKTSLAEAMLLAAGEIRSAGRVDRGDTHLDTDALERSRGITIFSSQAHLMAGGTELTLLDAPGHVDFSAEAERTLSVLDYAVLVIGINDGVTGHTLTLWRLLERYGVPTFIFVNKTDLAPAGDLAQAKAATLLALQARLADACLDATDQTSEAFLESAAATDEAALDEYLEAGSLTAPTIARLVAERKIFSVLFGSALKHEGISELLEALDALTQRKTYPPQFAARVYKVSHEKGERITWLKLTGGCLRPKELLTGTSQPTLAHPEASAWSEKVNQLRIYQGAKFELAQAADAGQIVAATGLTQLFPGSVLGAEPQPPSPVLAPVLVSSVSLNGEDASAVLAACRELAEEDPLLAVSWSEQLQEIRIQLMGAIQLEVLRDRLHDGYGLNVDFGPGSILYKETVTGPVMGYGHFEPLRHYAEAHLRIEPVAPSASEPVGRIEFGTVCSTDDLALNWQRLILTNAMEREHKGVLTGAPLANLRITLVSGRAHPKHTEGGDFRQATYRAIRNALMRADAILLEPWYRFWLEVPTGRIGRALADLTRMHATFKAPDVAGEHAAIRGRVPASEVGDYAVQVSAYTAGTGIFTCSFDGYDTCHDAERVIGGAACDARSDLANTPDSIFCSHGAGHVVAWDEVAAHAHVHPDPAHRRPWRAADAAFFGDA